MGNEYLLGDSAYKPSDRMMYCLKNPADNRLGNREASSIGK